MIEIPFVWQACLWSALASAALVVGALIGYFTRLPQWAVASVMAFGAGALIAALAFSLMQEAVEQGTLVSASIGFTLGVITYAIANSILSLHGVKHRKRAQVEDPTPAPGAAGFAIALGALLDGMPEAAAIGTSLLDGEGVAIATVVAIFLSNLPEGLSSSASLRLAGRNAAFVFGLWTAICGASVLAAWFGYAVLGSLGPLYVSSAVAFAAGAILVMIAQTMIPEAFENAHGAAGPVCALGFLTVFAITYLADPAA